MTAGPLLAPPLAPELQKHASNPQQLTATDCFKRGTPTLFWFMQDMLQQQGMILLTSTRALSSFSPLCFWCLPYKIDLVGLSNDW